MYQSHLRWQPIVVLLFLAVIWGSANGMIKIGARELAPLFMAGIRSLIASVCLFIWMKAKGVALPRPRGRGSSMGQDFLF